MIKSALGQHVDGVVHRLFPFLFVRRLDPNTLTVCGTLISLGAAGSFVAGHFVLGGVLMLAGGFFDLVDGVVARHFGISTRFGAFLDSTLDRLVDMALLLGISVHYAALGDAHSVLLAGSAMVASALVSYAKARAELEVASCEVGFLERGERVGLLAAGALFDLMIPALWIVALGSTITVVQRFSLARREMERMDRAEQDGLREPLG